MIFYFKEPTWQNIGSFDRATSSVMTNGREIGAFSGNVFDLDTTASHFCNTHNYYLERYLQENTIVTIAYYDDSSNTWKTSAGLKPFEEIDCKDGIESGTGTSTINIQAYNPTSTIATTTDIKIYGAMSAGEVLIATLLFCMIIFMVTATFIKALDRIKTKKKYIAYKHNEVEITDVL